MSNLAVTAVILTGKKMKESKIEYEVCKYAESKGFLVFKFSSPSQRGVPDRIFLKNRNTFFIEFKSPGKKPTKLQMFIFKKLKQQDFKTYIVDNIDDGKKLIDYKNV